jgi:hypothetical protein
VRFSLASVGVVIYYKSMNKADKNGKELNVGDRVRVKLLPWDPAVEATVWENQNTTGEKDVRVAVGNPATTGTITSVSISSVEKI